MLKAGNCWYLVDTKSYNRFSLIIQMAHLLPCYPYIPKSVHIESSHRYTGPKSGRIKLIDHGSRSNARHRNFLERERSNYLAYCCNYFSTSSAKEVELVEIDQDREKQFEHLISECGWSIRRLVEESDEMRKVAQIQAEAFHTPVALFDDLFFQFFKEEVLSGLVYKLRNSPPDRYACLVAEPSTNASESQRKLVGIVDVTVLRDEAVLGHLPGAQEYLYVSGLAVSKNFRRRKIASVLLKACDVLSILWGFEYLVLRAYEDDLGARKLYSNAGYTVVSSDPPWMTSWIGKKGRVLMMKRSN